MILQTIIQVIFYFLMIPFTILMAILTSMFIYWRYLHPIMLSYLPPNTKPHVMGPNFDVDDNHDNHEEFHKEKDQEDRCQERAKLSAAKTATSIKNRIVMTKEIDSLMKKIVDNLIEYYLLVWYRPLIVYDQPKYQSKSTESLEHFREALRDNLWKLFSCFIDRLYNVNHVTFISQDLIYRLLKHFQNLKTSSSPPPRSSSPLLVNDTDVVVGDGDVDEKHNIPNTKSDGDNQDDDSDDDVQTTSKSIGHRKNQPSSSSIQTNFSSTSSNCSGLSSICQPNQSSIGDADDDDANDKQSIGSQRPVASQLLDHLNPFKSTENISTSASKTTNDDPNHSHNNTNKCFFYPLASHLAGENEEKSLIHTLARFILDTLINDSSGYDDQDPPIKPSATSNNNCDGQKLSLIRDSRTLRSFLDDLLAKILYEAIQTITQPTLINCQIIKILESNFLLKDFIMKRNRDGDGNVSSEFDGDDDDDDDDESDDDEDDNDYSQIMSKKSVFILNEMKQCLVDNNFDHLYELIDKCNNVKLLKHIRLKLIAEILDAAVVSHLDKTVVGMDCYWQENQSRRSSNSSSAGGDYNPRQRHFNFNAKMDLKFKKFRKEKNLKRLVNRLKFAKTICEQKIQFRRRTLASALPDPNHVDTNRDGKVETFDDFDDISFKNDLVKSVSLDDSIFAHAHSAVQSGDRSGSLADQLVDQDAKPRPKHKKIFKFQQIMANEFSRDYFRIFLQQSLLQNDSNVNKRSSLMKFRKDVLLVDCTIYMFEFWLHLQLIFQTLLDWLQASNITASSGSKSKHHSLYESFKNSYNLLLIMVADQRFFYTFSRQFLSIPSDLMRSLERFLLGDLELNAMDISKISFQLNNVQECFLFQQNTTIKAGQTTADVLQKIDWRKHFQVFERLEKILFNCLNDEFYPQFLISKEYDEILLKYFEHGKSLPPQPAAKPTMILMDLRKKLPIEDWYDYWNNATCLRKSYMFQLDHRLRVKPVNKILLVNGQPRKSGLNSIGDSNDKKFIDLHKNRKMLLNTIEFPFCYLSFMQVVHVNRFKLKWTIKQIVEEFVQKRSEEPEDMSMNRLLEDLLSNLGKDLARLGDQIDQIKRILLRTFCWLNADFSTVINNCRFNGNYEELLLSSTVNTAESKILSFVENLFLKPSSSSSSSSSAMINHSNDSTPLSSSSDNLKFKVNVTALLSKFQYIHQQQQQQKLPTLPHTVRNELMSNWSYQWNVDITLQQLQTFHHRILIPFIRIIIFLARFQIKNYVTTIMDVLLDCSRDTDTDMDVVRRRPTNNGPFNSRQRQQRHLQDNNNNDIKILEKFVNKTNQILVEIRQIKRSMLNELKRNRFYFGTIQDHHSATSSSAKHVPDMIQNQTGGAAAATTISFQNLLKKEQQQSIEVVDTDVQEVTESSSLMPPPKNQVRESTTTTTMNNNEQNRLLKSMESLLNSYFQQIIAQDTIVKSVGFLHLIQYDQQSTPETGGQQECCLRCQLYDWMFEWNQDHALNHYVQLFLFRLLFDDHYQNRSEIQDGHEDHGHEEDDDHYWESLMNQMLDPNGENGGHQQQQPTMAANKRTDPAVRLNSKLFFMQARSLLMDRSALDCFDFTLDSLKCFTGANRTFCLECDRIMIDSRRRMIMQSASSSSFPTTTYRTNNHQQQQSSLAKFRLFINLSLDLDDQDHHQSTCSSTSNLMDLISNVGNSIGFGGGGGNAHKQTNSSATTTTSSSSSIFNLGNLFSSSNKHQPPPPAASTATGNSSTNSSNNIPDLLLNGGNLDEPSLFSLFNDENQLIEPLFLLLIEIFELEGGTVTKTLRRTLMFGMRLFFGQTKMMSRPYKQFMQTLFTEKNVFRWMSKVNAYLEELLKNQQHQQQPSATKSSTTATASRQHSRESDNTQPDVDSKIPNVDDNEDEYLKYLNDMLGSLETEKVDGPSGSGQDRHQASSNDGGGGVRIVQATAVSDCQPSTSTDDGVVDERKYLVEDDDNEDHDDGDDPILDEEQQRQLIRDRKLQIIAKQMLFVSIPTFLSHLFGQQNIDKGVNKCFDMLQYQKLNKHLVYEFIEAFLLKYFPEFRKLSTAATITTDGPMAEQQQEKQELD